MDIKQKIRESLIPQWRIAKEIGVSEQTIVRWLRVPNELETEKINKIEMALEKLLNEAVR